MDSGTVIAPQINKCWHSLLTLAVLSEFINEVFRAEHKVYFPTAQISDLTDIIVIVVTTQIFLLFCEERIT
jgi:hypothetical protein